MDPKATPQNIQDAFLNSARRKRIPVTIYLLYGAKLTGRIKSFDKFSILFDSAGHEQLVFKHAVATIVYARRAGDSRVSPSPAQGSSLGEEEHN